MDRYTLTWQIRYGMRFGRRQARAYERIVLLIRLCTITAGTAAFAVVVGDHQEYLKTAGLAVTALSILDLVWNPSGKAANAREYAQRFANLYRDAPRLSDEELQKEFDSLYDLDAPEWDSLRPVVYNDTLSEMGNDPSSRIELTFWQRFVDRFA